MPEENKTAPSKTSGMQASSKSLHVLEDLIGRYKAGDEKTRPTIIDGIKHELFNLDRNVVQELFVNAGAVRNKVDADFGINELPNLKIPKSIFNEELKTGWRNFSAEYDRVNYEKNLSASEAEASAKSEGSATKYDAAKQAMFGKGLGSIATAAGALVGIKASKKAAEPAKEKTSEAKPEEPATKTPSRKEQVSRYSRTETLKAEPEETAVKEPEEDEKPEIEVREPNEEEIKEILQAEAQNEGIQQALGGRIDLTQYPSIEKSRDNLTIASGLAVIGKQALVHEKSLENLNFRLQDAKARAAALEGKTHVDDKQKRSELKAQIRTLQGQIRQADADWKAKSAAALKGLDTQAAKIKESPEIKVSEPSEQELKEVAQAAALAEIPKVAEFNDRFNGIANQIQGSVDPFTREGASFYEIRKLKKEVRDEMKSNPSQELKLVYDKLDLLGSEFREGQILNREGKDGKARLMSSLAEIRALDTPLAPGAPIKSFKSENADVAADPKHFAPLTSRAQDIINRSIELSREIVPGKETPEQKVERIQLANDASQLYTDIKVEMRAKGVESHSLMETRDQLMEVDRSFRNDSYTPQEQGRMARLSATVEGSSKTTIESQPGPGMGAVALGAAGAIAVGIPSIGGGTNITAKTAADQKISIQGDFRQPGGSGTRALRTRTNVGIEAEGRVSSGPTVVGNAPGISVAATGRGPGRRPRVGQVVQGAPAPGPMEVAEEPGLDGLEQAEEIESNEIPESLTEAPSFDASDIEAPQSPIQPSRPLVNLPSSTSGGTTAPTTSQAAKRRPRAGTGIPGTGNFISSPSTGTDKGYRQIGPQDIRPTNQIGVASSLNAAQNRARNQESGWPEETESAPDEGLNLSDSGYEAMLGEENRQGNAPAPVQFGQFYNPMDQQGLYEQAERGPGSIPGDEEEENAEAGGGTPESELETLKKFRSEQDISRRASEQLTGGYQLGQQSQKGIPQMGQFAGAGSGKRSPSSGAYTAADKTDELSTALKMRGQQMQLAKIGQDQKAKMEQVKVNIEKLQKAKQTFKNLLDTGEIASSESIFTLFTLWGEWNIDLINKHVADSRIPFFEKKPTSDDKIGTFISHAKDIITIFANIFIPISTIVSITFPIIITAMMVLSALGIFAYFVMD